jgi:hypothetical protein
MTTIFEFKWPRPRECALDGKAVRQVGSGRDVDWEPLKHVPDLYLRLAELDGSGEACAEFATKYGLLVTPAKTGAAEPVENWQREIRKMKSLISVAGMARTANSRRVLVRVTEVAVALLSGEPGGDVKPALVLQPKTLLAAMQVQLASAQAGGAALQTCAQCGHWFEVGGAAKRSIAKFCSDKCRLRAHYERVTAPTRGW